MHYEYFVSACMFLASCTCPPKMQCKHTHYFVFLPTSTIVCAAKAANLNRITTSRVYSDLQLRLHFYKFPGVVYVVSLNFTCCVLCSAILQINQNILSENRHLHVSSIRSIFQRATTTRTTISHIRTSGCTAFYSLISSRKIMEVC